MKKISLTITLIAASFLLGFAFNTIISNKNIPIGYSRLIFNTIFCENIFHNNILERRVEPKCKASEHYLITHIKLISLCIPMNETIIIGLLKIK